jgi:outer membrane protein assembly factor BamB
VTVTKPDNTTETLGPFNTDTTGGTGTSYTPAMAGTYYFQTHFPEQVCIYATADTPANTTMLASDSEKTPLYVLDEPIQYYPGQALPPEYWSRPIDSQLREWSPIAGNWIATPTNRLALSNAAPETAHILWSRNDLGNSGAGLVGGEELNGQHGYHTGDAYEGKFTNSIIIGGVLYYNRYIAKNPIQEVVAVDLHTGKELWRQNWNNATLSFGQILNWDTPNGHGAYSYLWSVVGTTWNAYDPVSGTWEFSFKNVPAGTNVYGPNGEILRYTVDTTNGRLLRWNSTWAVKYYSVGGTNVYDEYSWIAGHDNQIGTTIDASNGYDLNVSIPAELKGGVVATLTDRIVGSSLGTGFRGTVSPSTATFWAVSTKAGQEGTLLFNTTWVTPSSWWSSGNQTISFAAFSEDDLVGILWSKELRQHYGVSLETGQLLWGPSISQNYMDAYEGTQITSHFVAYSKLYACGVGGTLYCYDVKTGNLLWNYTAVDTYVEYKISPNWWLGITFISDGKVYVGHGEHSSGDPKPRGAPYICLNATTGDVIWSIDGAFRISGMGGNPVIGDSIIAAMDTYDQQIYAIGKGPSSTTVTAPDSGISIGSSITIRGTVMDISPGTTQDTIALRFPNGEIGRAHV